MGVAHCEAPGGALSRLRATSPEGVSAGCSVLVGSEVHASVENLNQKDKL